MNKTKFLTQAALISAIYVILTVFAAPISYGMIQFRISEILTVLPYFTPAAIPGLFVGCLLANIFGGNGILDMVFGSLATLIAAYLSSKIRKKIFVPIPPIIINAIIIGTVLYYVLINDPALSAPIYMMIGWVGFGQFIVCYGLGYPLLLILDKYKDKIFK